ncbi:MAG TPA: sensor histidine kinase [Flavobacteriales bacterium]|nr:sensor histidine kinase [Flavobacteriales bacterium]
MLRIYVLLFIALVAQVNVFGQTDSIQKVYKNATSFKTKLESGNELIFLLRFENKPLAINIANTLLKNNEIKKYPEQHARAWIRLGIVYDVSGKADSAVICNEKALAIASKNNLPKQKSSALNNLGLIYWNYNQLDKATDYITQASTVFEQMKDTLNLANAINNLGLIMNDLSDREKGIKYHKQALELFKAVHDDYGTGSALHNIAFSLGNDDESIAWLNQAVAYQKRINDDYGLAKTYNNLGICWRKNPDSALHYYKLAIEHQRKSGNVYGQASSLGTLALYLSNDLNKHNEAFPYALESEKIAIDNNYSKYLWKIEGILGRIYEAKGDYKKAAYHFHESNRYKDSVMKEDLFVSSQQLEFKYNDAKKEKLLAQQKAEIANEKRIIAQKESESKTAWITLIILGGAAIILLGALGWYFNRKRLQNQKQFAQSLAEEREKSLQQTLLAQEEERQRIAKDLHDGIVQDLAVIKMNLDQVSTSISNEQKNNFNIAKENLEKTTKEVREISHQMMPTALRELGLVPALEDNLQKILPLNNMTYEFFSRGLEERLPEKIEISLYRISQELLNNVIKHSKATHVSLSITKVNKFITMHFEDNGKGFDTNKKSNGIGLTSLQSRVKIVNGEIRYESGENSGTVAIVRVPL